MSILDELESIKHTKADAGYIIPAELLKRAIHVIEIAMEMANRKGTVYTCTYCKYEDADYLQWPCCKCDDEESKFEWR